jgi:TonB family protein
MMRIWYKLSFPFILLMTIFSNQGIAQVADSTKTSKTSKKAIKKKEVDSDPIPKGGYPAFKRYLSKNIKYPPAAKEAKAKGVVYVRITIDEDGKMSEVEVIEDKVGYGCAEEAIRVLKNWPKKWKPAKVNGISVKKQLSFPIKFVDPAPEQTDKEDKIIIR